MSSFIIIICNNFLDGDIDFKVTTKPFDNTKNMNNTVSVFIDFLVLISLIKHTSSSSTYNSPYLMLINCYICVNL